MKDVIYLVANKNRIDRLMRSVPENLRKGEHAMRVEVTVDDQAFRSPLLTKQIHVEDWREGIDVSDVEFSEPYITEAEAKIIRDRREAQLIETLKAKGYNISKVEE